MTAAAEIARRDPAAVRHVAVASGLAAGLRGLADLLQPDALVCGVSGWALLVEDDLDAVEAIVVDDRLYRPGDAVLVPSRTPALVAEGLVAVRVTPLRSASFEPVHGATDELAVGAGQLRLGLSTVLLRAAQAHLATRKTGGTSLLQQPSVRSALADAALDQLLARRLLAAPGCDLRAAGRAHARVTRAGRLLLGLLGASGFLLTGPGRGAHVSELLANIVAGGAGSVVEAS